MNKNLDTLGRDTSCDVTKTACYGTPVGELPLNQETTVTSNYKRPLTVSVAGNVLKRIVCATNRYDNTLDRS